MNRALALALSLILMIMLVSFSAAEEKTVVIAKITTENKGPLKFRSEASQKSRVLAEIPNGTCILVKAEGETWCRLIYQDQEGYCNITPQTFSGPRARAQTAAVTVESFSAGYADDYTPEALALRQGAYSRDQGVPGQFCLKGIFHRSNIPGPKPFWFHFTHSPSGSTWHGRNRIRTPAAFASSKAVPNSGCV